MFEAWSTDGSSELAPVCGHRPGEWHDWHCYEAGQDRVRTLAYGERPHAPAPFSGTQCVACALRSNVERCGSCPLRSGGPAHLVKTSATAASHSPRPRWRALVERIFR